MMGLPYDNDVDGAHIAYKEQLRIHKAAFCSTKSWVNLRAMALSAALMVTAFNLTKMVRNDYLNKFWESTLT
jgi:hypothetical protein